MFYYNTQLTNLYHNVNNPLMSSLGLDIYKLYSGKNVIENFSLKKNCTKLNSSQLDIIAGSSINFFYTLTSNPQHYGNSKTVYYCTNNNLNINNTTGTGCIKFFK